MERNIKIDNYIGGRQKKKKTKRKNKKKNKKKKERNRSFFKQYIGKQLITCVNTKACPGVASPRKSNQYS